MGSIIPSQSKGQGLIGGWLKKKVTDPIANYVSGTSAGKVAGKVGLALADTASAGLNTLGYMGSKGLAALSTEGGNAQKTWNNQADNYAQGAVDANMGVRANSPYSYVAPEKTTLDKPQMLPQAGDVQTRRGGNGQTSALLYPEGDGSQGVTQEQIDIQNRQNRTALLDPTRRASLAEAEKKNQGLIGGTKGSSLASVSGVGSNAKPQDAGKKDASGKGLTFVVDGKTMYSPSGNRMDAVPTQTQTTQNPQTTQTPETLTEHGDKLAAERTRRGADTDSLGTRDNSYGGLIGELADRGRGDNQAVTDARKALQDSRLAEAKALGQVANPENKYGRSLSYQQGAGAVLQNLYGNEQNALASTLGSELTSQGQQIGALGSAAGMMSPMQYGLTMDPVTGQPINMASMQVPMQTALQLYRAGTPLSDPAYSQALGPLGSAGWMMFYNALQNGGAGGQAGGMINPAAQSAAQSQQLGFATSLQAQNQQLGQGLAQLNALQPQVTAFMREAGINPSDYPTMNEKVGTYLDRLRNPGASQQWNSIKQQLGNIVPQIIAAKQAGGMQPGADELIAMSDPSSLSMTQLNALMNTWKALGGTSLGVNQNLYQQSGGFGGVYQGGSPNQGSYTPAAPGNGALGGITDPTGQAMAGTWWQVLSSPASAVGFVRGIFS